MSKDKIFFKKQSKFTSKYVATNVIFTVIVWPTLS